MRYLPLQVEHHHLGGIANEKTEQLLQRYPFRRNSHRFCSPGYCRCFDTEVRRRYMPLHTTTAPRDGYT